MTMRTEHSLLYPASWAHMYVQLSCRNLTGKMYHRHIDNVALSPAQTTDKALQKLLNLTSDYILKPTASRDFDRATLYAQIQTDKAETEARKQQAEEQNKADTFNADMAKLCRVSDRAVLQDENSAKTAFAHRTFAIAKAFGLNGLAKNPDEAQQRLLYSAEQGDTQSTWILMRAYASGQASFLNVTKADPDMVEKLFVDAQRKQAELKKKKITFLNDEEQAGFNNLVAMRNLQSSQFTVTKTSLTDKLNDKKMPTALQMTIAASQIGLAKTNLIIENQLKAKGLNL